MSSGSTLHPYTDDGIHHQIVATMAILAVLFVPARMGQKYSGADMATEFNEALNGKKYCLAPKKEWTVNADYVTLGLANQKIRNAFIGAISVASGRSTSSSIF